ncbi:hypothetical protein KR215_006011 [Drosophila sulfurigaster]|nr:hypothetical protein KR215_006011 [Drosophila sulfurigaster]
MCLSKLLPMLLLIAVVTADNCKNGVLYAAEAANEYYYCVNGVLLQKECPGDNTYFDAHNSVCRHGMPPSSSATSSSTTSSPLTSSTLPSTSSPDDNLVVLGKCQRIGLTGDLTDCNRFYHCAVKGDAVQRGNCPDNHIFDVVKFTCVRGTC